MDAHRRHAGAVPFRFEEEHVAADQKDDADEQEDVHGKWSDLVNESGVGVVQLCGSCTVSGIRAVVECFYQDDGNGSSQHVQRGSADRLVCFQCDGGEAKQQRVDHTGYGARQNGKCHKCRSREVREQNQDEDTGKAADRHDSFQRDVDDTASLGEHTAIATSIRTTAYSKVNLIKRNIISSPPFRCLHWHLLSALFCS